MQDSDRAGLTKQRQTVLRVIREADEHLTANEVFEEARRLLPGISCATVYNSLRYLKQAGLIGEVRFGTDATRYDRTLTRAGHALRVAVTAENRLFHGVPLEPHDERVDLIITASRVHWTLARGITAPDVEATGRVRLAPTR